MKNRRNIIMLLAVAALSFWIGYAAGGALFYRRAAFTDPLLFGMSAHALYFLSFGITGIITGGIIISRILLKHNLAREAWRESEVTLRTITDAAKDAIVMMDAQGNISYWNPAAEAIFGYTADEAIGKNMHGLLAPQRYFEAHQKGFGRFQASGQGPTISRTLELSAMRKGGAEFEVELSLSALRLKGAWHAVGVVRDITERKNADKELQAHREQLEKLVEERTGELNAVNNLLRREILDSARTEEELSRSENFLSAIFDSFHDPFSIVDSEYRIIKFNDAYARMRGKRASDLFGKKCYEVLQTRDCVCRECIVDKTFQSKDPCAKEKQLTLPDGSAVWVEIYTYPIHDQDGNVAYVVEYSRDITDRKKEEEEKKNLIRKLNHLSTTDGLTGLLNRRALNDMLQHEIERASRYNTDLSLLLCDVDKFKGINDTFGHTAGDRALQAVAKALMGALRKADILGRYGGDEFMIILPETGLPGARNLAEKVRVAVNELDLELAGERSRLSISVGVASCCTPEDNIDTLVSLADSALYSSKQSGRNRVATAKK